MKPSSLRKAAQAATEGAAREQLRFRVNLMRILSICKTPSVLPQDGNPAPSEREPSWLSLRESWHLRSK